MFFSFTLVLKSRLYDCFLVKLGFSLFGEIQSFVVNVSEERCINNALP